MNDPKMPTVGLEAPVITRAHASKIDSLQIGMNWFDESPGGMERMVKALVQTLPE